MEDRSARAGRFVRISSKWHDAVSGLIGFLDNIKIWELAGEIPREFYTFPTMMKVLGMSISFSTIVALVGNVFDIAHYFLKVRLTPVWYALVFAFFYLRYYGSFSSFGINVYRTVMSTTIITLFILDNLLRNLLALLGSALKYSAFPDLVAYLPSYGFQFYHFIYFAVLFNPKKKEESALESKPLYSSKIVRISEEEYSSLVDTPEPNHDDSKGYIKVTPSQESVSVENEDDSIPDKLREYIREHIDKSYDLFIWDKFVYIHKGLVEKLGITTNGLKRVRIVQNGEVKVEGDYLVLHASELIDKSLRKAVMRNKMRDPDKKNMFINLKVEVVS